MIAKLRKAIDSLGTGVAVLQLPFTSVGVASFIIDWLAAHGVSNTLVTFLSSAIAVFFSIVVGHALILLTEEPSA